MSAEKVLAQVARLEQLLEAEKRAWAAYAPTANDPHSLLASPEWRAFEAACDEWDQATDDDSFRESMLALKRAAVEWAIDETRGEEFLRKQQRLIELALVVLEEG